MCSKINELNVSGFVFCTQEIIINFLDAYKAGFIKVKGF